MHSSRDTAKRRFLKRGRATGDTAGKHARGFDQFLDKSKPILELYVAQELMVRVNIFFRILTCEYENGGNGCVRDQIISLTIICVFC